MRLLLTKGFKATDAELEDINPFKPGSPGNKEKFHLSMNAQVING